MRSKRAAMEMSVGTIVTIVLLMSVLVLGIFLVQKVFSSGTNAIDSIDGQVQSEINKLFAEEGKKLVVYPSSREITLKQGKSGGFGFSVRNTNQGGEEKTYTYTISVDEADWSNCDIPKREAEDLVELGKSGSFKLGSGDYLENAILVKYYVPETAPLCLIRYILELREDGSFYSSTSIDLEIK